jgi:hypothetical protein
MAAKKRNFFELINFTSIAPNTELIEQLVYKLKKLSKKNDGYTALTKKSGNCLITVEINKSLSEKIRVVIKEK